MPTIKSKPLTGKALATQILLYPELRDTVQKNLKTLEDGYARLTDLEMKVATLLAHGRSSEFILKKIGVTLPTIQSLLRRVDFCFIVQFKRTKRNRLMEDWLRAAINARLFMARLPRRMGMRG